MYSLDSRLIDVAQGKGLISAEFSVIGEIEVLMSSGITSIARQLCEIEGVTEIVTETDKQKQVPLLRGLRGALRGVLRGGSCAGHLVVTVLFSYISKNTSKTN